MTDYISLKQTSEMMNKDVSLGYSLIKNSDKNSDLLSSDKLKSEEEIKLSVKPKGAQSHQYSLMFTKD